MDADLGKIFDKVPDALRPIFFLIAVLSVVIGAYVVVGVQTVNADNSCYTRTVACHGFTTGNDGNTCIGFERENIDYVEKSSCDNIGEIRDLCGKIKKAVCAREGVEEWQDEGTVYGKECSTWNQVYDLGMTSCQQ